MDRVDPANRDDPSHVQNGRMDRQTHAYDRMGRVGLANLEDHQTHVLDQMGRVGLVLTK